MTRAQCDVLAVAAQKGAVQELLACCSAAREKTSVFCAALSALQLVLGSEAAQEDFCKADKAADFADMLRIHTGACGQCIGTRGQEGSQALPTYCFNNVPCAGDSAVVEAAAACIQAAAAKHEGNKCAFMDGGVAGPLIAAARAPDQAPGALVAICGALRSFATADDARPSTSRWVLLGSCRHDNSSVLKGALAPMSCKPGSTLSRIAPIS